MKAVIVEIQRDYIVAVNRKGEFLKMPNRYPDRQVGDEIDIPEISTSSILRRIASIAAVLVIMTVLGYGAAFFSPATYVTMDANSSVEITLNRFDRAIDVVGLDEEGKHLVGDGRSFWAMPAEKVVGTLLEKMKERDFLGDEPMVIITISDRKDEEKWELGEKLQLAAKKEEAGFSIQQQSDDEIHLHVQYASIKLHDEARKLGISQGKLVLYEKLKERGSKLEIQNVKDMNIRDLIKKLEQ